MVSEITKIRQNIADEYMSAKWGLQGFAQGTVRHEFIKIRMEKIDKYHERLRMLVGNEAIALVAETIKCIPDNPSRQHIKNLILHEQGDTEETQSMFNYISNMWEAIDLLVQRFGVDGAHLIIGATSGQRGEE